MTHARCAELLALELYDELEAPERGELAAHLDGCADCRQLQRELARGLGALPRGTPVADPALLERCVQQAVTRERRSTLRRLVPLVASFAAGVLLTVLALQQGRATAVDPAPEDALVSVAEDTWKRFHADAAPPRAASSGSLSRYPAYVQR